MKIGAWWRRRAAERREQAVHEMSRRREVWIVAILLDDGRTLERDVNARPKDVIARTGTIVWEYAQEAAYAVAGEVAAVGLWDDNGTRRLPAHRIVHIDVRQKAFQPVLHVR